MDCIALLHFHETNITLHSSIVLRPVTKMKALKSCFQAEWTSESDENPGKAEKAKENPSLQDINLGLFKQKNRAANDFS